MNQKRWGESPDKFHPKTNRFIFSNHEWFFSTREEGILGPYLSKADAENALCQFLLELLEKNRICPI